MTNMPAIISLSNPKSPEAEAYRTLRTNLQFSTVDHALQTILVTSPNAAEGKTTTVCNLAVSFAQIGKKVLIIDGDLRRPRLHTYLGLSNTVGISNVLTQNLPVQEAMKESMLDIQVLTCGPTPPNPAELLMVIASHQTESDQAVRAMKLLQTVGAKVLGTVLTKVPADRKGYYGYQYYEYHAEVSKSKKRRVR